MMQHIEELLLRLKDILSYNSSAPLIFNSGLFIFLFVAFLALYLLLGSWKGYVALFEKGAEEPSQIFPCPVSALPEADQQKLETLEHLETEVEYDKAAALYFGASYPEETDAHCTEVLFVSQEEDN